MQCKIETLFVLQVKMYSNLCFFFICYSLFCFPLVLKPVTPDPTLSGPVRGDIPEVRFATTSRPIIAVTESVHLQDAVVGSEIKFGMS